MGRNGPRQKMTKKMMNETKTKSVSQWKIREKDVTTSSLAKLTTDNQSIPAGGSPSLSNQSILMTTATH